MNLHKRVVNWIMRLWRGHPQSADKKARVVKILKELEGQVNELEGKIQHQKNVCETMKKYDDGRIVC